MKNRETDFPDTLFDPDGPFDPDEDNPAEEDELEFSDDKVRSFATLSQDSDDEEVSGNDSARDHSISDDIEPEDLIKEDGARSPHELSARAPADADLSIVTIEDIGAGYGLDEAELAHLEPLDGRFES